jgi:hypothetical protein
LTTASFPAKSWAGDGAHGKEEIGRNVVSCRLLASGSAAALPAFACVSGSCAGVTSGPRDAYPRSDSEHAIGGGGGGREPRHARAASARRVPQTSLGRSLTHAVERRRW